MNRRSFLLAPLALLPIKAAPAAPATVTLNVSSLDPRTAAAVIAANMPKGKP